MKLEEAKRLLPSDAEILGNLGFAYYKIGDLYEAQTNLTASLKLKPKRGSSWGNLADVLADLGYTDWATEAFVNYWMYSQNKQAATNHLTERQTNYPNLHRGIAATRAKQILNLY